MGYQGKKDEHHSSDRRNRVSYSGNRDHGDMRASSSHVHSRDGRDDQHFNREPSRKHDQSGYKHSKYRNRNFYPDDKNWDNSKTSVRSRSLSPQERKYHSPEHKQDDYKEKQSSHKEDTEGRKGRRDDDKNWDNTKNNDSDSDTGGESSIFSKYQQKAWKTKNSEPTDGDKRSSVLVRCLDHEVTEEQVENAVSDVAIRNGFSTPNSVVFKTFHTDSISGSLYCPENKGQTSQYPEGYSYPYALEKVAIVTFPSVIAASKFISCNKSRSVKILGREYYLEYDTSNNDSALKATNTNDPLMPAVSEIASLLQKRKMNSDWNCPCCRFLNFAKRVVCMACGIPKPTEAELERENMAIELAAINQAKMLQSNLSDVSPWVIIKNIPGDADPAKLVLTICKNVPDAPAELQRCVYVIDTNAETKRGFMFAQFASNSTVEKYMEKRGDKKSEVVQCGNLYHRLDIVRSREKHFAEELFKKVKMANFKVDYEFDTVTGETNLTSEDNTMTQLNKEYRSCKVKTTNISAIQQNVSWSDGNTTSQTFFSNWVSDCITLPSGKPDTGTFHYDPNTDYFFDHRLSLYYDAATSYYMSLTGNYYLWDEPSSSLRKVDPNTVKNSNQSQRQQQSTLNTKEQQMGEGSISGSNYTNTSNSNNSNGNYVESNNNSGNFTNNTSGTTNSNSSISNILASAMKVAQVSQQNVQKLSSVKNENNQSSRGTTTRSLNVVKTFELAEESDEESDMEMEESSQTKPNQIKVNLITTNQKNNSSNVVEKKVESTNICFLCLKAFDSFDNLKFHEKESKYHQALLTHVEVEPY